jgi:hypothetical protein
MLTGVSHLTVVLVFSLHQPMCMVIYSDLFAVSYIWSADHMCCLFSEYLLIPSTAFPVLESLLHLTVFVLKVK